MHVDSPPLGGTEGEIQEGPGGLGQSIDPEHGLVDARNKWLTLYAWLVPFS